MAYLCKPFFTFADMLKYACKRGDYMKKVLLCCLSITLIIITLTGCESSFSGGSENVVARISASQLYSNEENSILIEADTKSFGEQELEIDNSIFALEDNEPVSYDITEDQLEDIMHNLFKVDQWVDAHGSSHVDWNQYTTYNGLEYYKVIDGPFSSAAEVYDFIGTAYTQDIVNRYYDEQIFVDIDGSLYSYCGGVGGIGPKVTSCKAVKDGDGSYQVHLHLKYYDFDMDYDKTNHLINEDGKWVFDKRCETFLYDFDGCDYSVE